MEIKMRCTGTLLNTGFGTVRGSLEQIRLKPIKYGFKVTIKTVFNIVKVYFVYEKDATEYIDKITYIYGQLFTVRSTFECDHVFMTKKELKNYVKKQLASDVVKGMKI